jgi:uncharacterized membrane protein
LDSLFGTLGHFQLTVPAALVCVVLGVAASVVGGIVGGILVGGKDLGAGLAGMMGGFYGPVPTVPAMLLAMLVLFLV